MSLPARTFAEHFQDAGKAFAQLAAKHAELVRALERGDPEDEAGDLNDELQALAELWSTVMDELVEAARRRP